MVDFSFRSWLFEAVNQAENESILDFLRRAQGLFGILRRKLDDPETIEQTMKQLSEMLYMSITRGNVNFSGSYKYSPISRLESEWGVGLNNLKSSIHGIAKDDGGWFNMFCTENPVMSSSFMAGNKWVKLKNYFKPLLGNLDSDPREVRDKMNKFLAALPKIYNASCHMAKKLGGTIAIKVSSSFEGMINHKNPMVIYFDNGKVQKELVPVVNNILSASGLENSSSGSGFDIGSDSYDHIRAKQVAHDLVTYILNNNGMLPPKPVFWIREKLQQRGMGSAFDIEARTKERMELPRRAATPSPTPQPAPATPSPVPQPGGRRPAKLVLTP